MILGLPPLREALDVDVSDSVSQVRRAAHQEEDAEEGSDGMSAYTTKSHHEDMIFGLKALFVDSEQLVDFLATKDFSDMVVVKHFQQLNSRGSEKLRRLLSRFRDSCEPFEKEDSNDLAPFHLWTIVRKLLRAEYWQQIGIGKWRPDAVFQLANLTNFAAALLGPDAKSSHHLALLKTMSEDFPSPFMYGFGEPTDGVPQKGYSSLLEETFLVGLEIRTQFAVALLTERNSEPNFDPDEVLEQVFSLGENGNVAHFQGFIAEGLRIRNNILPKDFELPVSRRIQALREHFSESIEGSVNIRSLTASFPWAKFISETMVWIQARAAELIQQIDQQGGINSIQQGIEERINSAGDQKPDNVSEGPQRALLGADKGIASSQRVPLGSRAALLTNDSRPVEPLKKSLTEEARRLKELKEELKARVAQESAAAESIATATALVEEELEGSSPLEAGFEDPPVSTARDLLDQNINLSLTKEIFASDEMKRRESNKENIDITSRPKTFVDRQESAQKVPWDDHSQETPSGTSPNNATSRKQPRTHTQESNEDEGDFENRSAAAPNKRRKEIHDKTEQQKTITRLPAKRIRSEVPESLSSIVGSKSDADFEIDEDQAVIDQQLTDVGELSRPPPSFHRPPPSHQPPQRTVSQSSNTNTDSLPVLSAPLPSTAQQLEFIRARARDPAAAVRPRKLQTRTYYSLAEETRLTELIEEHGISYALIKQMDARHEDGPLLLERSQVQLKDKAQDLKFQFLKSVVLLSPFLPAVLHVLAYSEELWLT